MINSALRYCIIIGLAIIVFLPLYVANDFFFPFITGKAFAFRIIVEIIFALWVILIMREKGTSVQGTSQSVAPRINSLTIFVTIFVFFMLVADLFGLNPLRSIWSNFERMEGWLTLVHLWAYFLVLSSVLTSREHWNKFFDVILVSGFITALYGLFQFFGVAETHQGSRVDASLGNAAYMAVYMLLNAFIAIYMAFGSRRYKALVWIYSVLAAFFSFIMFQTATRGTILGWTAAVIISCLLYAFFAKDKNKKGRLIAGGIIGLIIVSGSLLYFNREASWIQQNEVLRRMTSISLADTKTQARGYIWPMAVREVFDDPKSTIIGVGQENFNYIFNENYDPRMWSHEQWFDRAHSVFLDWLVAGGVVGLGLYLSLYVLVLVYIYRSDLNIGQKVALTGLIIGYAVHNIFVFDNQTSYVMFFTILAYVHSFKPGKAYKLLGASQKNPSADALVVRDYVLVPITIILFLTTLYFINVRPIQANTRLIHALRTCSTGEGLTTEVFERALKLDQTVANQEIREQYYVCAGAVTRSSLSDEVKMEFYNLAKQVTSDQIADTPNDARAYIIAGGFYNSVGDFATAEPLLQKAHELSPAKQTIIFELASNYLTQGKTQEAVAILKNAYESAPENPDAKVAYVVGLVSAGQEEQARELFPNEPSIFLDQRVINTYIFNKEYSKAIQAYEQVLSENPNEPSNYSSLATLYMMNNQPTMAIQLLRTASERFPELKTQIDGLITQIEEGNVTF